MMMTLWEMIDMEAADIQAVIKFGQLGLQILAKRILTYFGFIACAGVFGVAMWLPSWERAVTASLFALLVYWPILKHERRSET